MIIDNQPKLKFTQNKKSKHNIFLRFCAFYSREKLRDLFRVFFSQQTHPPHCSNLNFNQSLAD